MLSGIFYVLRTGIPWRDLPGYSGLYTLVEQQFGAEPQSGKLWVFTNRRRNLLKSFWWDDGGICVLGKTRRCHHNQQS